VVGDGDGNRKPVGRRRVSRRPPAAAAAQGGVSEVELLLAGSLVFFFLIRSLWICESCMVLYCFGAEGPPSGVHSKQRYLNSDFPFRFELKGRNAICKFELS
jgi:hypothetical protein